MRWLAIVLRISVLVAVVAGGAAVNQARAQLDPAVRSRVPPAVVQVAAIVIVTENDVAEERIVVRGSGTVVSPDGLVLTNHHVVELGDLNQQLAAEQAQLERQGRTRTLRVLADRYLILAGEPDERPLPRFLATVVRDAPDLDLAVLQVLTTADDRPLAPDLLDLPYLELGDSDAVQLGEQIHLFGYPAIGSGLLTYTQGPVSSFDVQEGIAGRAWITTEATVSGGSSGGAAVDGLGRLIGIPTQAGAIECRPGDTNRDGVVDELDVGCIPIGGTLNQLRPANLAKPLLADLCAVCTPTAHTPPPLATLRIAVDGVEVPYTVQTDYPPLIVTTPDGGGVAFFSAEVALEAERDTSRLYAARFDPKRNRWLPAKPLPGGPIQFGPAAVVDSAGVVHLVFSDRASDAPDAFATLVYTRSYGQGLWEPPVPVAPDPNTGHQTMPALAVDAGDRLHLIWLDQRLVSADDRLLWPDGSSLFVSEFDSERWSIASPLTAGPGGGFTTHYWPRLAVAGDRLIATWSIPDRGALYLEWAERLLGGAEAWSPARFFGDDDLPNVIFGRGSDLRADRRAGAAVLAVAPSGWQRSPVELRVLPPGATEWGPGRLLVAHDRSQNESEGVIDNLSLAVGTDGTAYAVFEHGPAAERETTIVSLPPGAELPSPEAILTADDPGPQVHSSVAVAADGALWVLYMDAGGAAGELRVRRWLPRREAIPATVAALLPTEAEVPLPLSPADGWWDPVALAAETPRTALDPAEVERRLSEDWDLQQEVLLRFDATQLIPAFSEVSIDEFATPDAAAAALTYFFDDRAAAGLTDATGDIPQFCLHGDRLARYLRGPAVLTEVPDGQELTLYLQWRNLLVRMTEVYALATPTGGDCPQLPLEMGARLEQVSQGLLSLDQSLPTQTELRLVVAGDEARTRDDLVQTSPQPEEMARRLDEWGWRGNVVRRFVAPETGLTLVETGIFRLASPEAAAAALAYFANDRAVIGELQDHPLTASDHVGEEALALVGAAVLTGAADQYEATIFVQAHELLIRVTAVSTAQAPVETVVELANVMVAKRPPPGAIPAPTPTGQQLQTPGQ